MEITQALNSASGPMRQDICQFGEAVQFDTEHSAKCAWMAVFNSMPYTNLWMIDYLIHRASTSTEELSFGDLCRNPKVLKNKTNKADILNDNSKELTDLPFKPGSCGPFAIQVGLFLQPFPEESPRFSFDYYDLGRHRLSRCRITQIVSDSSSDRGAFRLADRDEVTYGDIPRPSTLRFTFSESGKEATHRDGKHVPEGRFEKKSTHRDGRHVSVISTDEDSSSLFTNSDSRKPPKNLPPKMRL